MFKSKDRKTELDLIMTREENKRITLIIETLKKRLSEMENINNGELEQHKQIVKNLEMKIKEIENFDSEENEQLRQTIENLKTRIIDLEKNDYADEIRTLESKLITYVFERIEINKLLSEMEKLRLNASIPSERKYYEVYRVFSDFMNDSNSKIKEKAEEHNSI